jgi:bifunctional non-homologous end joining protein LigD
MASRGGLAEYHRKRNFARTGEPKGEIKRERPQSGKKSGKRLSYLIQKHAASRLHYDFRLEWHGTLLSWAVPKGPSENPQDKRLAVHVEDHPVEYGQFEGTIPEGEYGGGTVMLWDRGTWEPHGDVDEALKKGKLAFDLHGERLHGQWALVRLRGRDRSDKDNWLLIKERDELARKTVGAVEKEDTSIASGRSMEEIAAGRKVWHSNRKKNGAGKSAASFRGAPKARARNPVQEKVPAVLDSGPAATRRPGMTVERATIKPVAKSARSKKNSRAEKAGGKLPAFVSPQLATLVDAPPPGPEWLHEIKFDGYRAIASLAGGKVVMRTRKGLDWTGKFQSLVPALSELRCESALLDGEIVVADAEGHTDFGALQNALSNGGGGIGYYLFDLLELDGEDLRKRPLDERKSKLARLLRGVGAPLGYSDHLKGSGEEVFSHACRIKLEGIVSKRRDAPYVSGRSQSWLKSKCGMEQEFVIIGWRPSDKPRRPFRSLLLGLREEGELRYAGRVGSGYSGERLDDLAAQFRKLERKGSPAAGVPPAIARHAHFLEPKLVAQIAFRGWTRDNLVRQGSFKGLRTDKPPSEIVREQPMPKAKAVKRAKAEVAKTPQRKTSANKTSAKRSVAKPHGDEAGEFAGVRVTHPDRVLFEAQGLTKRDLIDYYLSVSDLILPHVANRPLSLVRCPQGSGGECFFQKHASQGFPAEFGHIRIKEKSATREYMVIEDERGLVAAVQVGTLELHVWGARTDTLEKPDRMVFDFDPDEGLPFARVRDAAKDMRERLRRLGLESFAMATGGKGIHGVVPLAPKHGWDEHRNFAEALARLMEDEEPARFVANMSKARRKGRIFVDYLRNGRGATAISPYSTRARAGAFVATPVSWLQLARLKDAHPASIEDARKLLKADPWPDYEQVKQALPLDKLKL